MSLGWMVLVFILMLLAGMPVAFIMGFSASLYLLFSPQASFLDMAPQKLFSGMDAFVLMCIPFFILAGEIMTKGKIADRIVEFANLVVGRWRGGLAHVNILASMLFAGITGVALGDIAALGSIFIPAMKKQGYDGPFSAAVTASSSIIGPIIPPSMIMVIYGAVTSVSIGALFAAAIIPGILMGLSQMCIVVYLAKKRNYPKITVPLTPKKLALGTRDALVPLVMPAIIIFGILSGVFTPTEAAGVAVLYAFVVASLIYRSLKITEYLPIFKTAVIFSAKLLLIVGCGAILAWVFGIENVPEKIKGIFYSISRNKYLVLLMINLFLVLLGMWLDCSASIILFAPMLTPLAVELGVHPVHFGVLMIVNLNIGLLTPPLAVCLFAAADISKDPVSHIVIAVLPFLVASLFTLGLVTYIPAVTLTLPALLGLL
ncbi:MAG: TRAP transporter large permease [Deltaproteobacteria bacterium]|nr:TRAP transporter large permease [Deltaproteobacteria bacterium]MBW2137721.1 TRAP transporter large permease [Deltaproteobacteria bacterium]